MCEFPEWLDNYIFNILKAKYSPDYIRFEYNLNLNKDEVLIYLGTYFPRSYIETNSLGEPLSKSATLKMVARLGCLRLQTYALVMLKLIPNSLASHVWVMPRFFKCSLIRLLCSFFCPIR